MKVSAYLFLLCCTVAVPVLAADGPVPALDLGAEPLATQAVASCNAPLDGALFTASGGKDGGGSSLVTCTADCGPYSDVSCSTSGTCTAVDRNCPSQRGWVTCNGVTTFCPVCPQDPVCEEDDFMMQSGDCCDCTFGGRERFFYRCIGGQWVLQSSGCGPGAGCPICP